MVDNKNDSFSYIFTGVIPEEIGRLRNLGSLFMGANKLTGPLSSSIFNNNALYILSLENNTFSGMVSELTITSI